MEPHCEYCCPKRMHDQREAAERLEVYGPPPSMADPKLATGSELVEEGVWREAMKAYEREMLILLGVIALVVIAGIVASIVAS
jgi:hypothetical protein